MEISKADMLELKKKNINFEKAFKKLNQNYPIQYIIGDVDFLNTKIKVDERALIPRYETEFLVDKTLKKLKQLALTKPKILDLGTGSGCIAIALKKNYDCEVTAVDISKQAISLAQTNATLNKTKITFLKQSMLKTSYKNYDIIISNPPYVSKKEEVGKEVKYEPENAIFAKEDGLYYYKRILNKIAKLKQKPLLIIFEIGSNQKQELTNYILKVLPNYKYEFTKDLSNKDRYLFLECIKK